MIAFIASPEKIDLIPQELINNISYEIIHQIKDINGIVFKIKNATHYTQIIIDVSLFENEQDEVLKALFLLKSLTNTNISVISQGSSLGDILLSDLVKIGIYNFVLSWIKENAQIEMIECLKGKGYDDVSHYVVVETQAARKTLFKPRVAKTIQSKTIQVIGACSRIGTTTQAIRIAKSLILLGHKACYVEKNSSGHLNTIKNVISQAKAITENTVMLCDLPLCIKLTDDIQNSYEYIVCDYGSEFTPEELDDKNKTIIVAGSTAWEMMSLPQLMEITSAFDDVRYLFSFTDKRDREDILDFVADKWTQTYFSEYSPDMFSNITDAEKTLYNKLIFDSAESNFSLLNLKRG